MQMEFSGKQVLVVGAGVSGIAVAKVLKQQGADVVLNDAKSAAAIAHDVTELEAAGVSLVLGEQNETLLTNVDYLVISPGISQEISFVQAALAKQIPVISEVEVAYQLCQAPLVAVTGTNGKTTTTTLLGELMKTHFANVAVGGNIGDALSAQVVSLTPQDMAVAEVSSFQLEGVVAFRPTVAAILNITPDHMDRHHTMDNYIAMKKRVFTQQTATDCVVLNYDDALVRRLGDAAPGKVCYFSRQEVLEEGAYVRDGQIELSWQGKRITVAPLTDLQLKGAHNIENVLAACAVAFLAGVPAEKMRDVLRTFTGVEHRIEYVTTIDGVPYYNDSKATNPESAIKALESFDGHIILIAGGKDKMTDLTPFMQLVKQRVDHLILIGQASERFAAAAKEQGVTSIHCSEFFADAVRLAYRLAKTPQVVLLSPACASYDMFKSYEERGTIFKELVETLSACTAGA